MPGGPRPPLEVIASWPAPNYINPEGRGTVTSNLAYVLSPITFFIYFARLWVRFFLQRNAGIDDWLMVAALPLVITLAILVPWTADKYHSGVHIWDVDLTLFTIQRKLILTIEILFVVATGLIKVSILLFFRRLGSRGTSKTFRTITWIAIGFQTATTIAFFISPLVGCVPLSAYWEQSDVVKIAEGVKFNCNEEGAAMATAGVVSTVQDVITALLPNFIYWKAKIPFRQKFALMSIFAIAYGAAAFGAMRTYSTWYLFYRTYDVSWQLWEIWNWTLLEFHLGVICANAPALKVFVKRYLNIKSIASSDRQGNSSQAKTPPVKVSPTASQSSSNPSGKSRSKLAAWMNPYAGHGYYSQPTQLSIDSTGGMHLSEKWDDDKSDTKHSCGDSIGSGRHYPHGDIELGILPDCSPLPSPLPQAHQRPCQRLSVYWYDCQYNGARASGGLQYLGVDRLSTSTVNTIAKKD